MLERLAARLARDPTNLDEARDYWRLLTEAAWERGADVELAFRCSAEHTDEGLTEYARAYRELHASSGEPPRAFQADAALRKRAREALTRLDDEDLWWLVDFVEGT